MSSEERKLLDFYTLTSDQPLTVNSEVWYRSCTQEIPEPIEGIISGEIPEWLNGSLIVNGPGTFNVGTHKLKHLFDGMALLQKFEISARGKITYQNKFVKSEAYTKGNESNRLIFGEFGTAPTPEPKSFFKKIAALASKLDMSTDNTFISVYPLCGEFYAMTETPRYNKINPKTLDTLERLDLEEKFDLISYTAHPHITKDGSMYNVGYSVSSSGSHYNVIHFPKGEKPLECAKIVAKIPARFKLHPSYMHSFGITENYFIIIETPFTMSVTSLLKMVMVAMSFTDILKWLPDEMTRIVLIDQATGNVKHVFHTDAFYFLYVVNQYEKDDHVLIDICCYKNSEIIDATFVEALNKNDPREAHKFETKVLRFALPTKENPIPLEGSEASAVTKAGKVICMPEALSDVSCIFPCINYDNFNGVDYQFFYAVVMEFDDNYGALVKADVKNKTKLIWNEEKIFAWEPQFVPSPDAQSEDDGLIVAGFSYIGTQNRVGLIILDAKDMKELARCEFDDLPTAIPKPLHGYFIKE